METNALIEQPFVAWAELHDVGSLPPPTRSWWPTCAVMPFDAELVQLLQ